MNTAPNAKLSAAGGFFVFMALVFPCWVAGTTIDKPMSTRTSTESAPRHAATGEPRHERREEPGGDRQTPARPDAVVFQCSKTSPKLALTSAGCRPADDHQPQSNGKTDWFHK